MKQFTLHYATRGPVRFRTNVDLQKWDELDVSATAPEEDVAAILALEVDKKYVDSDGDMWTRTE